MKILLVEDNYDLALNVTEFLEIKDHIVDYAGDGLTAYNLLSSQDFDVVILDVMLPGMDGFSLCRRLRDELKKDAPVIMLTAKDTEQDKLEGFRTGADDYLVKPFSLPELLARITALSRRNKNRISDKILKVSDLQYDQSTMEFHRGDTLLSLKPVPREILILLMRNAHRVVTRHEIEQEIWSDAPPDSEVLRTHIYAIRREIEQKGSRKLLHTIHGVGYRLVAAEA